MIRARLTAALGAIAVLALLAASAHAAARATDPADPSGSAARSARPTQSDAVRALLRPRELGRLVSNPAEWWPNVPDFYGDIAPGNPRGVVFLVGQVFFLVRAGGPTQPDSIVSNLYLFKNAKAARAGMRKLGAKQRTRPARPRLGDESVYVTESADGLNTSTVRFRVGRAVARLSISRSAPSGAARAAASRYVPARRLVKAARPVAERIRRLLAGRLRAAALPASLEALMPPASAAPGSLFGTAVTSLQPWALSAQDPTAQLAMLNARVEGRIAVSRTYRTASGRTLLLAATLIRFTTDEYAAAWVDDTIAQAEQAQRVGYDPGATGDKAVFTASSDSTDWELQFAKGRMTGDVYCFDPDFVPQSDCEQPARRLAEAWYAALS